MNRKITEKLLLIIVVVLSFISGNIYSSNFTLSLLCLIPVILLTILREILQDKKLIVSDKEPLDPVKGDLWVDTR